MTAGGRHYDAAVDPSSGSAHARALRLVGTDRTVLELGPASGVLTEHLQRQGCTVTAVEADPAAGARAVRFADRVLVADLDALDLAQVLAGHRFDVVLAGDVLEHLKDPVRVLGAAVGLLAPGGRVVLSLPNVAHGSVRLALLEGRFDYAPHGLLDETHLRFFTRASVLDLCARAGLLVEVLERVQVPLDDPLTGVTWSPGPLAAPLVAALDQDPEALTLQYVLRAVPCAPTSPDAASAPSAAVPWDEGQAALLRAQARLLAEAERENERLAHALAQVEASWVWRLRTRVRARLSARR